MKTERAESLLKANTLGQAENSLTQRLTSNELISFSGCEHIATTEAKEIVNSIHILSEILLEVLVSLKDIERINNHPNSLKLAA